jgi:hypothetical protein
MQAVEAARIFHDWAAQEGLLVESAAQSISTSAEMNLVQPVTEQGRGILRAKQILSIAFNEQQAEISVFLKRVAPSKKQLGILPDAVDNITIRYRQGALAPIGGEPPAPFGGPAYVVRQVGQIDRYTCGSSISVGNCRDAGTLGALVRDAAGILHGISNNHVSGGCSFASVGLPIVAPGIFDVVAGALAPFTIGFHSASLPFLAGSADNVNARTNLDAAIFRIRDEALVSSFQGTAYDTPVALGTLVDGLDVEKVGRTTSHTRGEVLGQIYGAVGIPYAAALYNFNGTVSFEPVFAITGVGGLFSDFGDSGSLITAIQPDGQRIAVGMVIGGRTDNSAPGGKTTLALPIAPIVQGLGVSLVAGLNV